MQRQLWSPARKSMAPFLVFPIGGGSVPSTSLGVCAAADVLAFSPLMEELVNKAWVEKTRQLPNIFDGPLWSLEAYEHDAEISRLILHLQRTSYRYKLFARQLARSELVPCDEEAQRLLRSVNSIGVGAVLLTVDNLICLGKRAANTPVAPEMWCYPGGTLDSPDPEALILRELFEELGVSSSLVTSIQFSGLWDTGELHGWIPAVIYAIQLSITAQELEQNCWPHATDKAEHTELAFIDANDPCRALNVLEASSTVPVMPFARAVVEYHGCPNIEDAN